MLYLVWIQNEMSHTDRIMCRCTNRNAADAVAKWVNDSQNLHAEVVAPERW